MISDRLKHGLGVAERARTIALILGQDAELPEAAAVLHDIGQAPDLANTGFHPLDGAAFLRAVAGADERITELVAHHSCAWMEAELAVYVRSQRTSFLVTGGLARKILSHVPSADHLRYRLQTLDPPI